MTKLTGRLLPVLSGVLLAIAFPPAGLSALAWIALVPLLAAVQRASPARAFVRGLVTGVVFRVLSMSWLAAMLHNYTGASWPVSIGVFSLLAIYLAAYTGLFTWSIALAPKQLGARGLLIAPFSWAAVEYANERVLTGFHWLPLAASQSEHLNLIQIAEFTGTYGVSFLIVLGNTAACFLLKRLFKKDGGPSWRWTGAVAAFALASAVGVWSWGLHRVKQLESEWRGARKLRVRMVNPAVPQDVKWTPEYRGQALRDLATLSEKGSSRPDLVLWPEAAAPFNFEKDPFSAAAVRRLSSKLGAPILFGAPGQRVDKEGVAFTNSAWLLSPTGKILGRYDKRRLVPFGEYVPLRQLLPAVPALARGLAYADLSNGRGEPTIRLGNDRIGLLICYEAVFEDLVRDAARKGAQVLVNLTNDAWLGRAGALQHLAMARFAAIETRLPMVRVANRGVSALFAPSGRARCVTAPERRASVDCVIGLESRADPARR